MEDMTLLVLLVIGAIIVVIAFLKLVGAVFKLISRIIIFGVVCVIAYFAYINSDSWLPMVTDSTDKLELDSAITSKASKILKDVKTMKDSLELGSKLDSLKEKGKDKLIDKIFEELKN